MKVLFSFAFLLLSSCVTINIYFPAAAAEKVADEIIREIQQEPGNDTEVEPQSSVGMVLPVIAQAVDRLLSYMITPAHAEADLSIETAEIRRIRSAMGARFSALNDYYRRGLIGIKQDGLLVARGSVPLQERNKVNKLIAAENADRNDLYRAIANANGHPEWFDQIKETFAKRWIEHAQSGWWYQHASGNWKQR